MSAESKQIIFIFCFLWGAFHVFALTIGVFAEDWNAMAAATIFDLFAAVALGANWLSKKIFKDDIGG